MTTGTTTDRTGAMGPGVTTSSTQPRKHTMIRTTVMLYPLLLLALLTLPDLGGAADDHDHDHAGENAAKEQDDHTDENPTKEHDDHGGDEHGHDDEEGVTLDRQQRESAGIAVEPLTPRPLAESIEAPGEIRLNAYATSQVTSRIAAQVVERHARLGDRVEKGQRLVTLSSVAMAEAQGEAQVAAQEWRRVSKLGRKVVSERRYLEAKVAWQQARARLLAYGMTERQADRLQNGGGRAADGRFTLLSPQDGTVIRDDFVLGQMVAPGQLLFEITDESRLWVEARVRPEAATRITPGATAEVEARGRRIDGKVVQIHHAIDEATRTLAVRIEIPNPDDRLHPGQFVTVRIHAGTASNPVLALPLAAVLRSPDGDWQVFVEQAPGRYEPREVTLLRQVGGMAVIDGLAPGTRVVTRGAFFVQSELAKSGFAVHNH